MMHRFLCGIFLVFGSFCGLCAQSFEKPWTFDIKLDRPQQVAIDVPLKGEEGYWYMLYEVTNNSGADQYLLLNIWVVVNGDEKRTIRDGLIPILEKPVERNLGRKINNRVELIGTFKNGQTRRCVRPAPRRPLARTPPPQTLILINDQLTQEAIHHVHV